MADPDDLLEVDGDLNDVSYDLDCAEEDALLADDNDAPYTLQTTRHVTFSDNDVDDDTIELGVEDDLQVPEDSVQQDEGLDSSYSIVESSVANYKNIVDSDDEDEKRKKDRSRFTNERTMVASVKPQMSTLKAIPDSLDKVEVKNNKGGNNSVRGKLRGKPGGNIRPVRPINIHINPHFRQQGSSQHHQGQSGPPRGGWDNSYGHPNQGPDQHMPSGHYGHQPYSNQFQPQGISPRGRHIPPQVWNAPPQSYNTDPYDSPYQDPYYNGPPHHGPHMGPHGPHHGPPGPYNDPNYYPEDYGHHQGWGQGGPNYPLQHSGYLPGPPQGPGPSPHYGGPHNQGYGPPGLRHPHPPRPHHIPSSQFQPRPPIPPQNRPQLQGSNLRSRLGPPVKRNNSDNKTIDEPPGKIPRIDGAPVKNLVVSIRPNVQPIPPVNKKGHMSKRGGQGHLIRPQGPGQFRGQAPGQIRGQAPGQIRGQAPGQIRGQAPGQIRGQSPGKIRGQGPGQIRGQVPGQIRGQAPGQIRGQAPGQIRGQAPGQIRHRQAGPNNQVRPQGQRNPGSRPQVPQAPPQPPKNLFPGAKEEELNDYMKKIEEQKQKREAILKEKEEKRQTATSGQNNVVRTVTMDGGGAKSEPEMKVVRVKTKDGKIVLRKLPLERISRMKKLGPDGEPIVEKTVQVNNLSASTNKSQIMAMAKQVGTVQSIELIKNEKRAKIKFAEEKSAKEFINKFQRKMVDLSMIMLSLTAD